MKMKITCRRLLKLKRENKMITYEDGTVPEVKDVVETGNIPKIIPNNTELNCRIVGVVYVEGKVYQSGDEKDPVLQVKLEVTETGEFKGIVVNHDVKLWDMGRSYGQPNDDAKARRNRDKAIDFLIKYDSLSGGNIARHKKQWYELIGDINEWFAGTNVKVKFGVFESKSTTPDGREIKREYQFVSSIASPDSLPKP